MKFHPLACPFLCCSVFSKKETLFWHDNWISLDPLVDITGNNGPMVSGIPLLATVASACVEGHWSLPRGRHPILPLIRQCLPHSAPVLDSSLTDLFLWKNGFNESPEFFSNLDFSTSSHSISPLAQISLV